MEEGYPKSWLSFENAVAVRMVLVYFEIHNSFFLYLLARSITIDEACIGVLGIQDICHFTSRDIGYNPFYFQGYGILGSIFSLLPGILKILEN